MIRVNDLVYSYEKGQSNAIKNISFEIEKGEIFGFLGPSGAGKTTTQKLIIGMLRNYSGSIRVMDKERKKWSGDFFENIGVSFDFPNLYNNMTGYENLRLIDSYYKNKSENILDLIDYIGLTKDKDRKIKEYSKGMKMRLNFIRSIMNNPKILFLDEPTSGLDPVNAKIVKDKIIDMKNKGCTIFLTTHNMNVATELCDRVAFINEGKLLEVNKPKNLMLQYGKSLLEVEYLDGSYSKKVKLALDDLDNEKFYSIIKTKKVITMHTKEATLEDIFIKLSERELG